MARLVTSKGDIQLKDGTAAPVTFSRSDIRDLSKKTGDRSKTLTAVGNNNNNQLLGFLFDVNITNATFDINKKVECQFVDDEGATVMQNAILQLVSVEKEQKNAEQEDEITYSLLVKSKSADLFTLMDNDELTELDFTELNHEYTAANVVGSFNHNHTDGYVYPQSVNTDNDFTLTDFRPAIYLKRYFDKIHGMHGFSYEVDGVDFFNKLVIPYNGDDLVGSGDLVTYTAAATKSSFSSSNSDIDNWTELSDEESMFNPTTGTLTSPFYISVGQGFLLDIDFDFDLILNNPEASDVYLNNTSTINTLFAYFKPMIEVYKNGGVNPIAFGYIGEYIAEEGDTLSSGSTTVLSISGNTTIAATGIDVGDTLTFRLKVNEISSNFLSWRLVSDDSIVQVTSSVDMNSMEIGMSFTANAFGYSQLIKMNDLIPKKFKQKDLIKSVCTLFNLMVFPDDDNPNKIIYKTRDKYLDEGATFRWSKKLIKNKKQKLDFLPELTAKKLKLKYKDDKDPYNEAYIENVDETYGEVEFTFDNEFVKGVDEKKLEISPSPIIKNPNNAYVLASVGAAPKNNVRLLIHNGVLNCDAYNIFNFANSGETNITTYANIGHFDHPTNPTIDLNFGVCDYYFYQGITLTNNNVFNMFWRRTASQINNGKMLTAEFDLSPYDIQNIDLAAKIYIDDSWWNINKIIDYDANSDKYTKVELISVDDYIDIPAYRIPLQPVLPVADTKGESKLIKDFYEVKNLNLSLGSVDVYGKNNVVQSGLKGIVIGDNKMVTENGVTKDDTPSDRDVISNGEVLYKARLVQSGTSAPTTTEYINNTGETITTARFGVGIYEILGFNTVLEGNLEITISDGQGGGGSVLFNRIDTNKVRMNTYDSSGTISDGVLLGNTSGTNEVYNVVTIKKY